MKPYIEIDGVPKPTPLEDQRFRVSTKSAKARLVRRYRNAGRPRPNVTPAPFGKEKFVRSGRFGAALTRGGHKRSILSGMGQAEDGSVVERPRGTQKDYSLDGLSVSQLRDLASRRGLKGLYTAKKAALIAAIEKDRF